MLDRYGEEPEARFYLASSLGHLERYDEALRIAAGLDGESRAACLRARLLAKMNHVARALTTLQEARQKWPTDGPVAFETGRLEMARGALPAAGASFTVALVANPADAAARFWLARVYLAQGRTDDAREQFSAVAGARGVVASAQLYLGQIAHRSGDFPTAVRHLEEARRGGCTRDDLIFELAASYAETGQHQNALSELSVLALKTDSDGKMDPLVAHNLAAISCRLGRSHLASENYPEAVPLLQQAADFFSDVGAGDEEAEAKRALAEANFRLGVRYVFGGGRQVAPGVAALERARALDRQDSRFAYYLGAAYFFAGDFARAIETLRAIPGGRDSQITRALALALERSGAGADAAQVWQEAVAEAKDSPEVWIEAQLGFAGYCARKSAWREAAEHLQELLSHPVAARHQHFQEICKLAASYFSLAGDHAAAEKLIRNHLSGLPPETASTYLGAILASQNRAAESLEHLQRAVTARDPAQAVRDLFDAVSRVVAAQKVLKDKLPEAVAVIKTAAGIQPLKPATKAFLDEIELALLLGEGIGEVSEKAVAIYEKAQKADPKNPKIMRNLAILYHRLAIQREDQGVPAKADEYWPKACKLWSDIGNDRHGFWRFYTAAYNEGRHERDRFKESDAAAVRERVLEGVSAVNVEFARHYLGKGNIAALKRHVNHAKTVISTPAFATKIGTLLMEEAQRALRTQLPLRVEVADYLHSELLPGADGNAFAKGAHLEAAVNALWDSNVSVFQKHISRVHELTDAKEDLKKMSRSAAQMERSFVERVTRLTKQLLDLIPGLDREKGKVLLMKVVLNICSACDSLPSYQRNNISDQLMIETIMKVVMATNS